MANEVLINLAYLDAKYAGQMMIDNGITNKANIARACFKAARNNFMAPDDNEAFAAGIAAMWELFPDDDALRQETKAIGDRNKVMLALESGVAVDMEAQHFEDFPENSIGLLKIYRELLHGTPN